MNFSHLGWIIEILCENFSLSLLCMPSLPSTLNKLFLLLLISLSEAKMQQPESLFYKLNITILNKTPKVWFLYMEKMISTSLERIIELTQHKTSLSHDAALSKFVVLTRHFPNFANRDVSFTKQGSGEYCPLRNSKQSLGRITLPKLESRSFPHIGHIKYNLRVTNQLRVIFLIEDVNIGSNPPQRNSECDDRHSFFVSEGCETCWRKHYQFCYCGKYSGFNIFWKKRILLLMFNVLNLNWGWDHFYGMYQVFDTNVLYTHSDKRSSDVHFWSSSVAPLIHSVLFLQFIQVPKFKHIYLTAHADKISVFDGPGFQFPQIKLRNASVFSTTSFHCMIKVLTKHEHEFSKIVSYISQPMPTTTINLTKLTNVTLEWPLEAPPNDTDFETRIHDISVEKNTRISVHVKHLKVKQLKVNAIPNSHCDFAGVAAFESEQEIFLSCEPPEGAFQQQNTVNSRAETLTLVVYVHKIQNNLTTQIVVSKTYCSSVVLDLPIWPYCFERDEILKCNTAFKQKKDAFSNISFAYKFPKYDHGERSLYYSVPSGQCGVIHVKASPSFEARWVTLTPLSMNLNQEPLSTTLYFSVTGSFKAHKFSFSTHALKFFGSFDQFTSNIKYSRCSKSSSANGPCMEGLESVRSNEITSPPLNSHFSFHASVKQGIGNENVGRVKMRLLPGGPSWIQIVLTNKTKCASAPFFDSQTRLQNGFSYHIPQKADLAFQVLCKNLSTFQNALTNMIVYSLMKEKMVAVDHQGYMAPHWDDFLTLVWQSTVCSSHTDTVVTYLPGQIQSVVVNQKHDKHVCLKLRWHWDYLEKTLQTFGVVPPVASQNKNVLHTQGSQLHEAYFISRHSSATWKLWIKFCVWLSDKSLCSCVLEVCNIYQMRRYEGQTGQCPPSVASQCSQGVAHRPNQGEATPVLGTGVVVQKSKSWWHSRGFA